MCTFFCKRKPPLPILVPQTHYQHKAQFLLLRKNPPDFLHTPYLPAREKITRESSDNQGLKKNKGRKKKLLPVIQLSWLNTSQFIHISGSVFIAVSPLPCLLETGPFVDTVEKLHMLHVVSMLIQESQTLCWFLL